MAQRYSGRSSVVDADGVAWQTASLPLGTRGLDLRVPIEPDAMTETLNARFDDERTVLQRDGHDAELIHDGSDIANLGPTSHVLGTWVFGHGALVHI